MENKQLSFEEKLKKVNEIASLLENNELNLEEECQTEYICPSF